MTEILPLGSSCDNISARDDLLKEALFEFLSKYRFFVDYLISFTNVRLLASYQLKSDDYSVIIKYIIL